MHCALLNWIPYPDWKIARLSCSAELLLHRFSPSVYLLPYEKSGNAVIISLKERIKMNIGRTLIMRILLVKISAA